MWYTYIVRCVDNTLYTGVTTDIGRRLREHNGDIKKGAKYTLRKRPVILVYLEGVPTQSAALIREWEIKKLSRAKKSELIARAKRVQ